MANHQWKIQLSCKNNTILECLSATFKDDITPGDLKDKAPLSISQAKTIISRLLMNWLDYKLSKF